MNNKELTDLSYQPGEKIYCTRCGKNVRRGKEVWIELSTKTGQYGGEIPEAESQGMFVFGPDCAKNPNTPWK